MRPPTVLIVDDSELDQRLIAGLIRTDAALRIEFADNGVDALERMATTRPDLVITDLVMPQMDGLQLVRAVREQYPDIPVILLTAHGNESTAVDALRSGAASYVPKALQAERLPETVERIQAQLWADRNRQHLASCLREMYCSYTLDNDLALVTTLVDQMQQTLAGIGLGDAGERIRVCVAFEQAMLNAMYHGNLEISEDELARARATLRRESLARLVAHRRGQADCRDRKVVVDAHISREGARFVIRDQGHGFVPETKATNRLADYFEGGRSRGLMLMRSLMDEVTFNRTGNEVTLVRRTPLKSKALDATFESYATNADVF